LSNWLRSKAAGIKTNLKMIIHVGSKNPAKFEAVRELLKDYPKFSGAEILSFDADSGIAAQPKSAEETAAGAMNRAKNSFRDCDYSIGLEDGLIKVPGSKTGYVNTTFCAIYDGEKFSFGLSSGFEMPKKAVELISKEEIDLNEALYRVGITQKKRWGDEEKGIIHMLSGGRITRKERMKQAIQMAIIQIENPELY
jgi:inosine/xanthosine triphosphatase